jgi:hypothetical protein
VEEGRGEEAKRVWERRVCKETEEEEGEGLRGRGRM